MKSKTTAILLCSFWEVSAPIGFIWAEPRAASANCWLWGL